MKLFVALALMAASLSTFAEEKISIFVSLTPAGSFTAESKKPKGNLIKEQGAFSADKISVSIESFKTGIDLRDEHFWKHLNSSKHPKATVTELKASGGKGTASLEVNNVKKATQEPRSLSHHSSHALGSSFLSFFPSKT